MLENGQPFMFSFQVQNALEQFVEADALPEVSFFSDGVIIAVPAGTVTVSYSGADGLYFVKGVLPTQTVGNTITARVSAVVDGTAIAFFRDLGEIEAFPAQVNEMKLRMEEQVPSGPVIINPAPPSSATKTVAYGYTLDEHGSIMPGVRVRIRLLDATADAPRFAYSGQVAEGVSDANGFVQIEIPRGVGLTFEAYCGYSQRGVRFSGRDAEQLQLPTLVEKLPALRGGSC